MTTPDETCAKGFSRRASFFSEESAACEPCARGTYAPIKGMPACLRCHPGTFAPDRGMDECLNCDPGSFASTDGASTCMLCPAGNFSDEPASPFCKPCATGTYSNVSGMSFCRDCPYGTFANEPSSLSCRPCQPGSYSWGGWSACDRCEPGTYSDYEGSTECLGCEAGYEAPRMGTTECQECYSFLLPLTSSEGAINCELSSEAVVALVFMLLALTWFWTLLPSIFRCSIDIDDVYVEQTGRQKRVFIRTKGNHWLSGQNTTGCPRRSNRKVVSLERIDSTATAASGDASITIENALHVTVSKKSRVPVEFHNTGHPFLGTSGHSSEETWSMNSAAALAAQVAHDLIEQVVSPLKRDDVDKASVAPPRPFVQPLTSKHLMLLNGRGAPETRVIETSKGKIRVRFPLTLIRLAPFQVPMLVWVLASLTVFIAPALSLELQPRFVVGCFCTSILLALMAMVLSWRLEPLTLRHYKLKEHGKELRRANPSPRPCQRGPTRAIRAGQLWKFYAAFEPLIRQQRTMYYVVSNLIMPLTKPRRISYAELAGPHKVNWFVSHFWGTAFRHFVFSIRKHAESVASAGNNYVENWADKTYWICSLSNNQWNIAEEVGESWEQSSFYLALTCGYCSGTAMILDDEAMPLTRAWCLFEVLQTKEIKDRQENFQGLWLCTFTGVLHKGKAGVDVAMRIAERLSTLRLEDATASVQKDKDMIDNLVSQMPGGFDAMNDFVKRNIAEALNCMQQAFSSDFQKLMDSLAQPKLLRGSATPDSLHQAPKEQPVEIRA